MLAAVLWDAGGDGVSFSDPINWSNDQVPGVTDDVTIDLDGNGTPYQVQVTSDQQVRSIRIADDDAQFRLSGGVFTSEEFRIDSGILVFTGGTVVADRLENAGTISAGRTVDFEVEELLNQGSFIVSSTSTSRITIDGTLRNSGTFDFNPASSGAGTLTLLGVGLINELGGQTTIGGGVGTRTQTVRGSINNEGSLLFGGRFVNFDEDNQSITNTGDLRFEAGLRFSTLDSNTTIDQNAGTLLAAGDVLLDNGTLNVRGGDVDITDLIRVDNSGSINVSGGTITTDTGLLFLNQRGSFDFTGGDMTGETPVQLSGNVTLNLAHDGGFNASLGGSVDVSGELSAGQSLTVNEQGTELLVDGSFINRGTIVFDNPGTSAQTLGTIDDSLFINETDGTIRFTRSANEQLIGAFIDSSIDNRGSIEIDTIINDSRLNTLTNSGDFQVTANGRYTRNSSGSGTAGSFVQTGGTLTNNGLFDGAGLNLEYLGGLAEGTFTPDNLVIDANSGNSGIFDPRRSLAGSIQPGQTVVINGDDVSINSVVTNAGTLRFQAEEGEESTLRLNAELQNLAQGTIVFDIFEGQSANVIQGSIANQGDLLVQSGTARIDSTTNQGTVRVDEGSTLFYRENAAFLQTSGAFENDGQAIFKGLFDYRGGTVQGAVQVDDGGQLSIDEGVNPASFLLTRGGEILSDIASGVQVTISNTGDLSTIDEYDTKPDFVVRGTLNLGDSNSTGQAIELSVPGALVVGDGGLVNASTISSVIRSSLVNEGSILVDSNLEFASNTQSNQNLGSIQLNDGSLSFSGSTLTNEETGIILGTGTLAVQTTPNTGSSFTNDGTIAPGQSPGLLQIESPSSQLGPTSRVEVEIDGPTAQSQFDVLDFSGSVSLDGQLSVETLESFIPVVGTTFTILNVGQVSGNFANTNFIGNPNAIYTQQVSTQSVVLTAVEAETDLEASIDLAPTSAESTAPVTVTFTVTNRGTETEAGNWSDRLYLSPTPAFDVTTAELIAEVPRVGDLATGESYSETVTADVPAVLPGDYHLILIADSKVQTSDENRSNNVVTSDSIDISIESLSLDQVAQTEVELGTQRLFRVFVPANSVVSVDSNSSVVGSHQLSIAGSRVPNGSNET
ncbi:MAG: CARDB domain-containing protein, partial [Planctomycetota bacterium]